VGVRLQNQVLYLNVVKAADKAILRYATSDWVILALALALLGDSYVLAEALAEGVALGEMYPQAFPCQNTAPLAAPMAPAAPSPTPAPSMSQATSSSSGVVHPVLSVPESLPFLYKIAAAPTAPSCGDPCRL
jgi:hypothetical protein